MSCFLLFFVGLFGLSLGCRLGGVLRFWCFMVGCIRLGLVGWFVCFDGLVILGLVLELADCWFYGFVGLGFAAYRFAFVLCW